MFEGARILLVGLVEIVLPAATIRLTDGGLLDWPARGLFQGADPAFGTIGSVDAAAEAIDDQAPGGKMTLLVPTIAAAVDLADPAAQGSPMRFWMAEADVEAGTILGTPELMFDGLIDTISLSVGKGSAEVAIEFMAAAERLFMVREGNVLSDRFHQKAWPGEKGFAFCTGSQVAVPWAAKAPPRGKLEVGPRSTLFG